MLNIWLPMTHCSRFVAIGIAASCASVVLAASPVSAQTHPCDGTYPTVYKEPSSQLFNLKVGFCHDGKDDDGNNALVQGFTLTVQGFPTVVLGPLSPLGQPNTAGDYYFETPRGILPGGGEITVRAYNAEGTSLASAPITLMLTGPPKSPKKTSVIR